MQSEIPTSLPSVLESLWSELARRSDGPDRVLRSLTIPWTHAVGPLLANQSEPLECDHEVLTVAVKSDLIKSAIEQVAPRILARLAARAPSNVRRLRCIVRPERWPESLQVVERTNAVPDSPLLALIRPELRTSLGDLIIKYLQQA